MQSGYWGRAAMDPEPGRCRRTDGKKWRCSRDVVAGQKYCERHVHRGRSRSRKPVEIPTPANNGSRNKDNNNTLSHHQAFGKMAGHAAAPHFSLSGHSPSTNAPFHIDQRYISFFLKICFFLCFVLASLPKQSLYLYEVLIRFAYILPFLNSIYEIPLDMLLLLKNQ